MKWTVLALFAILSFAFGKKQGFQTGDLTVKITGGGHNLDIVAQKDGEQRARFQFTTNGFPRWRVRTYSGSSNDTEKFKFRMGIFDVIEYKDTGAEGLENADEIVSTFRLTGSTKKWSQISQTKLSDDTYHFTTYLPLEDGKIQFDMWISQSTTEIQLRNGTTVIEVGPNRLEFALTIENYPYKEANTSLAVRALITSGTDAVVKGETISLGPEGEGGFFQWNNTVTCITAEGNETAIELIPSSLKKNVADSPSDKELNEGKEAKENNNFVVFSIPCKNPYKVVWDPSLGYDVDSGAGTLSGLLLCLLALLFVGFW